MTTLDFTTLGIIGFLLIGYALLRDWRETRVLFPEYRFPR